MADEGGEREEGGGEDDGDDAGGDEFNWQDGFNATVGGITTNTLGVVNRNNTLRLVQLNQDKDNYQQGDSIGERNPENRRVDGQVEQAKDGKGAVGGVEESVAEVGEGARKLGDDGDEDNRGDAVADSLLGNELAEPHEEGGAGDHGGDGDEPVEGRRLGREGDVGGDDGLVEDVHVGDGLDDGERDGDDAGPLVDFAAAGLAVLGHFFEGRDGFGEELDDDTRGDEGGETDENNRERSQATARDEVDEATKIGRVQEGLDGGLEGRRFAERNGDVGEDAIGNNNEENSQDAFEHVFVFERFEDGLEMHGKPRMNYSIYNNIEKVKKEEEKASLMGEAGLAIWLRFAGERRRGGKKCSEW